MVKDSKHSYGETAGEGTVAKKLAGSDEAHGDHSEGRDAGEKEIISAAQLDEVGQIAADEGRGWSRLHRAAAIERRVFFDVGAKWLRGSGKVIARCNR
jgi:hypothetical protein